MFETTPVYSNNGMVMKQPNTWLGLICKGIIAYVVVFVILVIFVYFASKSQTSSFMGFNKTPSVQNVVPRAVTAIAPPQMTAPEKPVASLNELETVGTANTARPNISNMPLGGKLKNLFSNS